MLLYVRNLPIKSMALKDLYYPPELIDEINKSTLCFQACMPQEPGPGFHYWIPDIDQPRALEYEPVERIEGITIAIAHDYQELVKKRPNFIKGRQWILSRALKWGLIAVQNNCITYSQLTLFLLNLTTTRIEYEVIHGNLIGDHIYFDSSKEYSRPILMTPNRFVTRPYGSDIIRAWCWYIAKGHRASDHFSELLRKDHHPKHLLVIRLYLLGAIFDIIEDRKYGGKHYKGDLEYISKLWKALR